MKKTFLATAFVPCLVLGCVSKPATSERPSSFDLVVFRQTFGVYSINGTRYSFSEVIRAVAKSGAKTVAVKGGSSMADAVCTSVIAIQTGKRVFLIPDGSDRPVALGVDLTPTQVQGLIADCSKIT